MEDFYDGYVSPADIGNDADATRVDQWRRRNLDTNEYDMWNREAYGQNNKFGKEGEYEAIRNKYRSWGMPQSAIDSAMAYYHNANPLMKMKIDSPVKNFMAELPTYGVPGLPSAIAAIRGDGIGEAVNRAIYQLFPPYALAKAAYDYYDSRSRADLQRKLEEQEYEDLSGAEKPASDYWKYAQRYREIDDYFNRMSQFFHVR